MSQNGYGVVKTVLPAQVILPLMANVFADVSPIAEILAFVLTPSIKDNPSVTTDLETG